MPQDFQRNDKRNRSAFLLSMINGSEFKGVWGMSSSYTRIAKETFSATSFLTYLQHNAHFWDKGCRFGHRLIPFLTPPGEVLNHYRTLLRGSS
jgi:hypothetical protein